MEASDKLKDYIYSFEGPAELDFFVEKQKQQLEKESNKLKKTQEYYKAVDNNPELGSKMERDIATGAIYSQGEMDKVVSSIRALEGMGNRRSINRSLVSPTGQRIIMSEALANDLGFISDGYILADELEDLVLALKADGIMEDKISLVRTAMKDYGGIVMQNGAVDELFDLLSEVAEYDMQKTKPAFESHGASLDQLKNVMAKPVVKDVPKPAEKPTARPTPKPIVAPKPVVKPVKPEQVVRDIPKPSEIKGGIVAKTPVILQDPKPIESNLMSISSVATVDDLKKIQVTHLRQGELGQQIQMIKNKIAELTKANKLLPYFVVSAFEESPLFQTYLTIGANLIFDESPDRVKAFEAAVKKSVESDTDVMDLNEFEAIADLRKQIESF